MHPQYGGEEHTQGDGTASPEQEGAGKGVVAGGLDGFMLIYNLCRGRSREYLKIQTEKYYPRASISTDELCNPEQAAEHKFLKTSEFEL